MTYVLHILLQGFRAMRGPGSGVVAVAVAVALVVGLGSVRHTPADAHAGDPGADVAALGAALAEGNPAPFSAVVRLPDHDVHVASASPERFLERDGDRIWSSPIKGTAATRDGFLAKDQAEVARRALVQHGLVTYAAVARVRPADLLAIHGIGPKAIRILGEELALPQCEVSSEGREIGASITAFSIVLGRTDKYDLVQYGDGHRVAHPPVADSDDELVEAIRFLGESVRPPRP